MDKVCFIQKSGTGKTSLLNVLRAMLSNFTLDNTTLLDEAIQQIKTAIEKTYYTKGQKIIDMNFKAVDAALDHLLHQLEIPAHLEAGKKPFLLDAPRPAISLKEYAYNEMRYKVLLKTNPEQAGKLMDLAQEQVNLRWETYEHMSEMGASNFNPVYIPEESLE